MDFISKVIAYIADYVASVPNESWEALGASLAASSVVVAIIAWINRSRLKRGLEKLGRFVVTLNVAFWSALLVPLTFIATNGTDFAPFLSYFGVHWTQYMGIAMALYNIAKPSLAWWKDRQAKKPLTNPNLPDFNTLVPPVLQPVVVPEVAPETSPPPKNLFIN